MQTLVNIWEIVESNVSVCWCPMWVINTVFPWRAFFGCMFSRKSTGFTYVLWITLMCGGGWGTCNTCKNPLFFHFWYGFWTHKLILFLSVLREERIIWVRAHWQIYVPIFVSYKFRYFLLAEIAGKIWLSNFCDLLYGPVCVPDRHPIQIQCWQRKQEEALNSKRLDFNG